MGLILLLVLGGCSREAETVHVLLGQAEHCDAAAQTCLIDADDGLSISLRLGPEVKPLVPFPIELIVDGADAVPENVVVDFQMREMDMGVNRYRLRQSSPMQWEGTATLPVCTASRMDWTATVAFRLDGRPYKLIYPFQTMTN